MFEIADAQVDGDGFVISWLSKEGGWFNISAATNLTSATWSPVALSIPGQHGYTSYTTTVENAASFYQIELE